MEPNPTRLEESDATHFSRFLQQSRQKLQQQPGAVSLKDWTDLAESYRITQVLHQCNGNRSAAARVLGIGRRTLYAKMDKLGISASWRVD